jgi:alanine dehydrogenase
MLDGVVHYAVANMPGIVPRTSTFALTNATLPFIVQLASAGVQQAIAGDRGLARGVNIAAGKITYQAVAEAHGLRFDPLPQA